LSWQKWYRQFEDFLARIPLERYSELREIKTVEQDLPKSINPMYMLYEYYWDEKRFVDFDQFFDEYWNRNIEEIMEFKEKYFWGCTDEFVRIGFRARIFRTWVSFLTQLHFMYLWNNLFEEKVVANAELDMKGIDGKVFIADRYVGFQVKKISYRREVRERKFIVTRRKTGVDMVVEIPYSVAYPDDLEQRIKRARSEETRSRYMRELTLIRRFLHRLNNGFVVFMPEYPQGVYNIIFDILRQGRSRDVLRWDELLELLTSQASKKP